jgi:phosphatidylglycerophosphatase C
MSDPDHGQPVVAAFDVDGTLTLRDCVRPFLQLLAGPVGLAFAVGRRPIASIGGLVRRDRDRLKEVVVGGVYRDRMVDDVAAQGRAFAEIIETTMLRADTVARLRWHQQMGHRTVLVSASLRSYLDPLARSLGVEHVLCTDVMADAGKYSHILSGPNCRGSEKLTRLRALLAAHDMSDALVWAYGDSDGDRELLAAAHHATWVKGIVLPPIPQGWAA